MSVHAICGAVPLNRQVKSDSLASVTRIPILYRFDRAAIDSRFMDNAQSLAQLRAMLGDSTVVWQIDSIRINATASPEGHPEYNYRLAQRRGKALYDHIRRNFPDFDPTLLNVVVGYDYWKGLVELVEADPRVPAREELLGMIADPNISDLVKTERLTKMNAGKTFTYLSDNHLLRRLRRATATIEIYSSVEFPEPIVLPEPYNMVVFEMTATAEAHPATLQKVVWSPPQKSSKFPSLALRTNLLLDIVGGPNVGVDVPIGRHLSVGGDFAWAYTRVANLYALQTLQATIEGRWWFKPTSNILTGWNVGIYGTYCKRFDIQWGRGYQGDGFVSVGVSGGYSWRLTDRLNLDVSALVGAVWLPEVRYYDRPQDGHLMWRETHYNATRFLPTMLRANLVWLIGGKKKKN